MDQNCDCSFKDVGCVGESSARQNVRMRQRKENEARERGMEPLLLFISEQLSRATNVRRKSGCGVPSKI